MQGYKLHKQDTKKNLVEAHELVERLHTQHREEMEEKNVTIDRLNKEHDDLKGELQRYKLQKHDLEANLKEAQNVIQRLHSGHQEELEALNAKHVAELDSLNVLMSKEQEERRQELETLKQCRSEVNNLKESLDKQIIRNKDLKQQVTRLTQDWDNSVARLRRKDASLEELKVKINELEASSESEISSLKKEITVRNEEITALKDKLFEMDVELELSDQSAKYEQKFAEGIAQMESQYKQFIQGLFDTVDQLKAGMESLQNTHAQEIDVLKGNLAQNASVFENQMRELRLTVEKVNQDELLNVVAQLKLEKEQELSQLKEQMIQESEAKIASMQEHFFSKTAKAEEENQQLITKLKSLEKNLSEVTVERKKLLDEVEVFGTAHRMLQETVALLEQTTSPVSTDELEHEEPQSVEGMEDLPGACLPQGIVLSHLH